MKVRLFFLITLFLIAQAFATCVEEDPMPKATQHGANTMAAKIDGKIWEARPCWGCISGGSGLGASFSSNQTIEITGQQKNGKDDNISIGFSIPNVTQPGTYSLTTWDDGGTPRPSATVNIHQAGFEVYHTSNNSFGTLTITHLDTKTKIISGTFEFTAENRNDPTKVIKVTKGRFDITYY